MAQHAPGTFFVGTDPFTIDIYSPTPATPRSPVVVIVHGVDGMTGPSAPEIRRLAEEIADRGYLACIPHYFGSEDGSSPLQPQQLWIQRTGRVHTYRPRIAAAVDFARTQPAADGTRVGLVGLSLGGGLALWHAENASAGSRIKAMIDFFGYISDPGIRDQASKLPPTIVFHNKGDEPVKFAEHSGPLIDALKRHGVTHEAHVYDEQHPPLHHHFRKGGPADVDSRARTIGWLDTHVKP